MVPAGKIIILSARTPQQCATNHLTPPVVVGVRVGVLVGVGVNVLVGVGVNVCVGVGVGVGHGFLVIQVAQSSSKRLPSQIIFGVDPAPKTWKQNPLVETNTDPITVDDGNDAFPPDTVPQQELTLKLENDIVVVGVNVGVGVNVFVGVGVGVGHAGQKEHPVSSTFVP